MPPIETNHVSRDLGFALHQVTTKKLKDFLHSFENDHMKWLEEILVVAKESFQRTKEPELLPKTPSVKNRRKRRLRKDNEENLPLSKKRRSQSLASKRSSTRRSVLAKVTEEAESKEEEDGDAKKSKENKKKVKITETTSEDMPIQRTAGYDAQTAEKERNNLVVQELAEKTSEATKTSTPPPETRKPRRGASRAATLRLKRQLDSEEQTCTPPQMTRMTRTASRTALQRSRLGSLRNKTDTTSQEASNTGVAESNEGAVSESVTGDLASKSKWAPKIELRHVIQSSKVKKLIHVHEEYIVASSSDDEHTPPKRLRLANGKKGRMEPLKEKPEENNCQGVKFFPPVSTAGGESTMSSASEKDTSVVTVKVSDSDDVTSASSDTGSGKEGNPTSAATPEETDCGTSQEVICISTSQDEGSAGSQQDEGRPAESTCDISHKSEEKTKPCSESSSEEVTKETAEKEETFEDSLDDKGVPDMEPDSLIEEPVRRQLRSRTMSVSTMKSEEDDSAGQQKRPNRAIRTKQRKGRKMSKKRSSVASTRSKRKSSLASIKSRSLRKSRSVVCQNEESQQESADNSHEADDESSPRRKIRRSDPEKVEVVVCNQNDTMELFEDSLEPNVQGKVSQHTAEEDLKSDDVAGQHPSSTSDKEVSPDAESTEEQHSCDSNEDEGNAAKIRRVDSCEEEEEAVTYSTPVRKPYLHGSGDDHSSGGSAVDSTPSPISTGGTHLRHKNYAASFLNALNQKRKDSGNYPTNTNGVITSFIKRNTPLKVKSVKERQKEMKQQIEKKQKKEEEIRRRREIERKQRLEEQKRKREERAMRAAEARKKRLQVQMEKAQQMEEKYEQKQALTEKVKEEKKKEEQNKKKIFNKKKAEAEARRKQEEELRVQKLKEQEEEQRRHQEMLQRKKEFEEAERLRKLEEARRRQEERMAELEREREREIQAKKEQEMEKERERQRLKEQREKQREEERRKREEERRRLQAEKERKAREEEERRAREEMERIAREERERRAREEAERKAREEAERRAREEKERLRQQQDTAQHEQEKDEKERERLKANILAHNESQKKLNTTITMESESYELTPQRTYKPATEDNYDIGDLGSDDSTDDEDAPRKKIPKWAQGAALKATLLNQEFRPPNLDELFDAVDPPDLALMFKKKRSRFFKRTSSAVWDSPMLKTLV